MIRRRFFDKRSTLRSGGQVGAKPVRKLGWCAAISQPDQTDARL